MTDVRGTFDALADRYDDWCRTPLGHLTEEVEFAALSAAVGGLAPGQRLLDVGCGTGTFAQEAARKGARVTAVDLSPAMVAVARAKAKAAGLAADFRVADGAALPFTPRSFEQVTAVLVLEFARDPSSVLREAARVLTPGGVLVVAALNRWSIWSLVRRVTGIWRPTIYREAHFFSRAELYVLLRGAGFLPEAWWGAVYYPPLDHPRLVAFYPRWEAWGRRRLPGSAAYLAIRAHLRPVEGGAASCGAKGRQGEGRSG